MRVTRGLVLSVWCGLMVVGTPAVTNAQVYESARRSLDFSPDPTERTPRLLGMGRLSLVSDVHNHIDFWDFAQNPVDVMDADSSSTFELRPTTSSAASRYVPVGSARERQNLAGRELRLGYEAWRRGDSTSTYGLFGDVAALRSDQAFDATTVLRGRYQEPRIAGVLNGPMPFYESKRMRYALKAFYASESQNDEYRTFFSNANGDYLGRHGDLLPAPNFFDPDEYSVSTLGGQAVISYRLGPWMTAAVGGTGSSSHIEGHNTSVIHSTGTGETRPYYTGEVGLIGRLLGNLEYGLDGRSWTSTCEERFVFTLKAGQNQEPFAGRGKILDRDETGSEGRGRLRWVLGSFEANVAASGWRRTIDITPPPTGDPQSYNYFLDLAANRDGADSLALPDSILRSRSKDKAWEIAYGAAWRLPHDKGLIGLESHVAKTTADDQIFDSVVPTNPDLATTYLGPDRKTWDVRGGLEYTCTRALKGRAGYIYRWDDKDERTNRSEFKSNTLTAGLGLTPGGATWNLDLGWAIEWIAPDFADATNLKQSRQELEAQFRWVF